MNNNTARCLVAEFACNARIEGMKAENQDRLNCNNSIAYGEDAFNAEAAELDRLAREIAEWSHTT